MEGAMIEEVLTNIYRMEIPLPGNPLKAVNSYVIKDSVRHLIIDTGLNRKECMGAMRAGIEALGIDLRKTDFFITHLHADHFALTSEIATDSSRIYFNRPDAERHLRGGFWENLISYARLYGFPEKEAQSALQNHPGYKYGSKLNMPLTILKHGDRIEAGGYTFECFETPGHTRGHMCLFENREKILFSGDHILSDITPNIQLWSDDWNPLREYLASLDRVSQLEVALVLPGHRRVFQNCRERIRELKDHHKKRAEEVLSILEKGPLSAYQVASKMSWDILYESWDLFPVSQKWFATGEAVAHLKYLEENKIVFKGNHHGMIMYSLNPTQV